MANFWHWVAVNWGPLGIGACIGGVFSIFVWFKPNYKELKIERQEKAEKKLDAKVLRILGDNQIWKSARIAEVLSVDRENVIESLDRLEMRERVRSDSGTMDDPDRIYWILHK